MRFIERLIKALAAQVAASDPAVLATGAYMAMSELERHEAKDFYGSSGHLVHYGGYPEIQALVHLIDKAQRIDVVNREALLPGDRVWLVGEHSPELRRTEAGAGREIPFTVRFVGNDGTVDIQPDFSEDYVIETVPMTWVRLI
jgi:hypothetical protein